MNFSDIDECKEGECEEVSLCENSVGGFICACPEGFTEYRRQCVGKSLYLASGIGEFSCNLISCYIVPETCLCCVFLQK